MQQDTKRFIKNVDNWIKVIRKETRDIPNMKLGIEENQDNIQHNYELIYELKTQLDDFKDQLTALKLVQIMNLTKDAKKKK